MEPTVTERQAVERERKAFLVGCEYTGFTERNAALRPDREMYAQQLYPATRVTRPREVTDEHDFVWRMVENKIEWRRPDSAYWFEKLDNRLGLSLTITRNRAEVIADLLANPTETVPDGE